MNTIIHAGRHDILLTSNLGNQLSRILTETAASTIFIITDKNTSRYCLPLVSNYFPDPFHEISTEPGEINKNMDTCSMVWKQLLDHGADRQSLIINLGGGMVTDLGGFVAATYKRGIRFINIPTSLLGMVDATSGGKTGIDLDHYKNMVGLFAFPEMVVIDPVFLQTLPDKEWKNGIAEIIKHALIADSDLWAVIKRDLSGTHDVFSAVVKQKIVSLLEDAIKVKADVVTRDPFEKNERMFLNFGHTIGHALESYSLKHDNSPMSHGEAVAAGMICESYISVHECGLSEAASKEIYCMITNFFPVNKIEDKIFEEVVSLMKADKKSDAGEIKFALLENIHAPVIRKGVKQDLVIRSFEFYNSLQ